MKKSFKFFGFLGKKMTSPSLKKQLREKFSGRSMMEMLCVLCIIALLSITAVKGWDYFDTRSRTNDLVEDLLTAQAKATTQKIKQGYTFETWTTILDATETKSEYEYQARLILNNGKIDYLVRPTQNDVPVRIPRDVCETLLKSHAGSFSFYSDAGVTPVTECSEMNNYMVFALAPATGVPQQKDGDNMAQGAYSIACSKDADCKVFGVGLRCVNGFCQQQRTCNSNSSCGECTECKVKVCDFSSNTNRCCNGVFCARSCSGNNCCVNGYCVCSSNAECVSTYGSGWYCSNGVCKSDNCDQPGRQSTCSSGKLCSLKAVCVALACTVDSYCKESFGPSFVCKNNTCQEVACVNDLECSSTQKCLNNVCQSKICANDSECSKFGSDYMCAASGYCEKSSCSGNSDCTSTFGNKFVCKDGRCKDAACANDAACKSNPNFGSGYLCKSGVCTDAACSATSTCTSTFGSGYVCLNGACVSTACDNGSDCEKFGSNQICENGKCKACSKPTGCATVVAINNTCTCTGCLNGYQMNNSTNQCEACPSIPHCLSGAYGVTCECTKCEDEGVDYIRKSGKCCKKIEYCNSYTDDCKCTSCESTYTQQQRISRYPSESKNRCCDDISNCLSYDDSSCACTVCKAGYKPGSSGCEPCAEDDDNEITGSCTELGYVGYSSEDVSYVAANKCKCTNGACETGYDFNPAGWSLNNWNYQCCLHIDGCNTYDANCNCTACSNNNSGREQMVSNYTGDPLYQRRCCTKYDGCDVEGYDSSSGRTGCVCKQCSQGYTQAEWELCCPNKANCQYYSRGDNGPVPGVCNCSNCNDGYKVTHLGNCKSCSERDNCKVYNDSNCQCYSCNSGYSLRGGNCCKIEGCTTLNSSSCSCDSCNSTSYDRHVTTGGTATCCKKIPNCASYNDNCTCKACNANYDLSGNKCCPSVPGCDSYDSSCVCGHCRNNYTFLTADKLCCPTISGCADSGYNSSTCMCSSCSSGSPVNGGALCCSTKSHCAVYNDDCSCKTCDADYTKQNGQCVLVCTNNDACASGEFCNFTAGSGNAGSSGGCQTALGYGKTERTLSDGTHWIRSSTEMSWWAAKSFCESQKTSNNKQYQLATRASLGCGDAPYDSYCTDSGNSGLPGKTGSRLAMLQTESPAWTSGSHWLEYRTDKANFSYTMRLSNSFVADATATNYTASNTHGYALCYACDGMTGCLAYNQSDCSCATCDTTNHFALSNGKCICAEGYTSDGNGGCVLACSNTGGTCYTNDDCCNASDFCMFDIDEIDYTMTCSDKGHGECRSISNYNNLSMTITINGVSSYWKRSSFNMQSWWSADNWCKRQGMALATRESIGCGDLTSGYCTDGNEPGEGWISSYPGRAGSVLRSLQSCNTDDDVWLDDAGDSCNAYTVNTCSARIGKYRRSTPSAEAGAFCQQCDTSTCATNDGCLCLTCPSGKILKGRLCVCPDIPGCASQNGSTCACTSCRGGYTLQNGTCVLTCPQIAGCNTYNNDCSCTICETYQNYVKVGEVCCPILPPCTEYNNNCTCKTCSNKYKLSGGRCDTLCSTISGCRIYSQSNCMCTECNSNYALGGYYTGNTYKRCCAKISYCNSYDENCKCTTCESPRHLTETGNSCCTGSEIEHCVTYSDSCNSCKKCGNDWEHNTAYYASNGYCNQCPVTGCSGFSSTEECKCSECINSSGGFWVKNEGAFERGDWDKQCCKGVSYCSKYNTNTCACEECSDGYTLVWELNSTTGYWEQKCSKSKTNCADSNCNSCPEAGYIPSPGDDVCCRVIQGCSAYDNNCKCTECGDAYRSGNGGYSDSWLYKGTCVLTCPDGFEPRIENYFRTCRPSNCASSGNYGDFHVCYTCNAGYKLTSDATCEACGIEHCTGYAANSTSGECICNACESEYTVVNGRCALTSVTCTDNGVCGEGEFCYYTSASSGKCVPTHMYDSENVLVSSDGSTKTDWLHTTTATKYWASAQYWCLAQGYSIGNRSILGCSGINANAYCTNDGSAGWGKTDSALYALQKTGSSWRYTHWLEENGTSNAYSVAASTGSSKISLSGKSPTSGYRALCQKSYSGACTMDVRYCVSYDPNTCKCLACPENYTLSNNTCLRPCMDNNDCASDEYCAVKATASSLETGSCVLISTYSGRAPVLIKDGSDKEEWLMSYRGVGYKWAAENWCIAQGYTLAKREDIGCGDVAGSSYCTDNGAASSLGKTNSVLFALQRNNWSETYVALGDTTTYPYNYYVNMTNSRITELNHYGVYSEYALCKKQYTGVCRMNKANCMVYNSTTCACTGCEDGYQVSTGECVACTPITGCTHYDKNCACTACESGYTLSNGTCVIQSACASQFPGTEAGTETGYTGGIAGYAGGGGNCV